ncbi:MAG TPA: hypothetical protein PKM27_01625 [Saprospiraceae bacterium]|nr:hypothetical protein [Saprospiraceae bacterium]HNT20894.1 hypothetical protein [Saprospiraceae bacterium]
MEKSKTTLAEKYLSLDFSEKDSIGLTEQKTLRILIGVLGVLLPLLLYLSLYVDSGHTVPLESISHYYYTRANSFFTITVSLLAVFLLIYKGKAAVDFYLSALAGIFALFLVLFPTDNLSLVCCDQEKPYAVTLLPGNPLREGFHYLSAAIFLTSLAVLSYFIFTKSNKPPGERSPGKIYRNLVYRTCGLLMALALLVVLAGTLNLIHEPYYTGHHLTFWMETLAVECFGISWLTKAEVFFKD